MFLQLSIVPCYDSFLTIHISLVILLIGEIHEWGWQQPTSVEICILYVCTLCKRKKYVINSDGDCVMTKNVKGIVTSI